MNDNRVEYGLNNLHYAVATDFVQSLELGRHPTEYGPVKRIYGAAKLSLTPLVDSEEYINEFGRGMYVSSEEINTVFKGYEGSILLANMPDEFAIDVLGQYKDSSGVLHETVANNPYRTFALLFEFDGDKRKVRHVLYSCTIKPYKLESSSKSGSNSIEGIEIPIKVIPNLAIKSTKAKTTKETNAELYENWYSTVYIPRR